MHPSLAALLLSLLSLSASQSAWAVTPNEALAWGASNCRSDVIADALAKGADVTAKDAIGDMPLHTALRTKCKVDDIQTLLNHHSPVNAATYGGMTPLHLAMSNHLGTDVIISLLTDGADINATDDQKMTPLFYSMNRSYPSGFQFLLAYPGINLGLVSIHGTVLQYAFQINPGDLFFQTQLLKKGAPVTNDILYALNHNSNLDQVGWDTNHTGEYLDLVKKIMAANPQQNFQDATGATALHVFCSWIQGLYGAEAAQPVAKLLIDNLAGLNQQDASGNTALHVLIEATGSVDAPSTYPSDWVKLFVATKADLNLKNKAGQTPLDLAKKYRLVDIEFTLENAGAQ